MFYTKSQGVEFKETIFFEKNDIMETKFLTPSQSTMQRFMRMEIERKEILITN
jgi:hypothetical protein